MLKTRLVISDVVQKLTSIPLLQQASYLVSEKAEYHMPSLESKVELHVLSPMPDLPGDHVFLICLSLPFLVEMPDLHH